VNAPTKETTKRDAIVPCWSCAGPMDPRAPFCHTCGVIQPPRSIDHFTRLGLKPGFEIDQADLQRKYFAFQRSFHPDRFAAKSPKERALSMQHATSLNEAYDVLKDTLKRAEYLITLSGGAEDETGCTTVDDPVLLIEAMELREELADADTVDAVTGLVTRAQSDIDECVAELKAAFAKNDIETAARRAIRLKYLAKLMGEARHKQLQLSKTQ